MAANTDPIYSKASDVQASSLINSVNASLYNAAGTIGTDVYKIFQADATNGGFVQRVRVKYVANATTTSVACVMKFFISSATSGAVTDANSWLIDEIAIPATSTLTTTGVTPAYEIPINFPLPAGWTLLAKLTVAQGAGTGFIATAIAGKY